MSRPKITDNFYDQETGELTEILNGKVVAVHKSILSNRQRSELIINKPSNIEPLVQPEMFEQKKDEIWLDYPVQKPETNKETVPLEIPQMSW